MCLGLLSSHLGWGQPGLLLFLPCPETVPLRLRSREFLELMGMDGWIDGEFRLAGLSGAQLEEGEAQEAGRTLACWL